MNFLFLLQICCEVTKQVSNYSMNYFSNGKYPIPQTMIVVLCELIKLLGTILRSKCKLHTLHFRAQSFTSLKADLCQDIKGDFTFSRCLNGSY